MLRPKIHITLYGVARLKDVLLALRVWGPPRKEDN